jgi:hypothetical protein
MATLRKRLRQIACDNLDAAAMAREKCRNSQDLHSICLSTPRPSVQRLGR